MNFAKPIVVRDAVHGDIELTPAQVAVLDTPQMQRLRGIKQLGAAYLVYPGCTHTRFEHSLGTLATAQNIVIALRRSGCHITADDCELIGIAALLHDVSHLPFGHTLEDERGLFPRHDAYERLVPLLTQGELGDTLRQLGVDADVLRLLTNGTDWRAQIVSSSIDADLLDYLRRDSYYAGISQDYDNRVYRYFCLADGQLAVDLAKHGMDRPDAHSEVLHLLRMRYFLTERIYLHHAKVAAGAMISKAVELCIDKGVSPQMLAGFTDDSLLSWLAGAWTSPIDTRAAHLARCVQTRRLYKRAYGVSGAVLSADEQCGISKWLSSRHERDKLAASIAARASVAEESVIVHCTGQMPFRELTIPAYTRHGLHPLNRPPAGTAPIPGISALEADYRALWRLWVFTPAKQREAVAAAATAEFGFYNELRR